MEDHSRPNLPVDDRPEGGTRATGSTMDASGASAAAGWAIEGTPFVDTAPLGPRLSAGGSAEPRSFRSTELVIVADGAGELTLDGDVVAFAGPCFIVMQPFRIADVRCESAVSGTVVNLANDYLRDLLARSPDLRDVLGTDGVFPLTEEAHRSIASELADLTDELASERRGAMLGAQIHLLRILLTILRDRPLPAIHAATPRTELVDRYRQLIEAKYLEQPDVEEMAAALGVTPGQLRAACREETGMSPLAMLHDRIAAEAKRRLVHTGTSVAEVGHALGFADAAYFTRFFSRVVGVAPSRFRRG